ncbi:MAG: hypothetical protein FWG92_04870 [Leptospirales bacterium]|nr:hypothetical protein [Leptospirales bacterium]
MGEKGVAKAQSRPVSPERADAKWTRMGGTWNIKDGRAIESRGIPVIWDFHELVNYNSLASLPEKNVSPFTEMSSKFSLSNVKSNVVEVLLAFALQSPQASYYYNFYAVRFALAKDGVQTASVIRSQRLDETLPFTAKKNYSIETLFVTDCTLEFNRDHEVRIVKSTGAWHETLKKRCDVITLFIDGKKIFNVKLHDNDVRGNFAVGARGASISLDHVTVKNRNAIVFADDFSKNSIFTTTVRAVEVR